MNKKICLYVLLLFVVSSSAAGKVNPGMSPLEVVQLIGDKLIRETPFSYRLELAPNSPEFNKVKFINFGRAFRSDLPAVAYAYTLLESSKTMEFEMELEHNDGCKIWLNNQLVYSKDTNRDIHLVFEERSIEMPYKLKLNLKKQITPPPLFQPYPPDLMEKSPN